MKVKDIFQRATDFGSTRSRENFFSFSLKFIFYIIPAVILGNFTDILVQYFKQYKSFGDMLIYYILFQTIIIISTLYVIVVFLADFSSEFQLTLAGSYFIVLYFGIQSNYINMIKEFMFIEMPL